MTATELLTIYADAAMSRSFAKDDLLELARTVQTEIGYQRRDGYAVSAADVFGLLTEAMTTFIDRKELPASLKVSALDGPARTYSPSSGGTRSSSVPWNAFAQAVRETHEYLRAVRRVPDEVWIGAESLSPADYLATLGRTLEALVTSGRTPAVVARVEGRYTADRDVAEDSPGLWSWPIFPEGFHAPRVMELARLQAWTLKPALMRH